MTAKIAVGSRNAKMLQMRSFMADVWWIGCPGRPGASKITDVQAVARGVICLVAIFDLDSTSSVDVLCANPMEDNAWGWMLLKPDPSSAFNVEKEARRLENTPNAGPIAAQLFRAWNMQQTLLQQATHRIAALELQLMERDR